ncbi:TraB/GumN family protein [Rheinheimera pleomorphica]|uniref:TraB/GumN family protein n=1 Tax=Rheinheimera pleomorphica TaxID=2703963 RepID=UPI00142026E6|nr:TraB/GumN family protein [Rheinheimera pleomorphica]
MIYNHLGRLCRGALILALAVCSASALAQSSLWKISKGDDYLYIGGTVHLLPPSAFPLPPEFEMAYNATDTLVLEAKMPEPTDTAAQSAMMQAMAYRDGRSLSTVLSPEVYQQVADYFAAYDVPLQQLDGYKPGFLVLQMLTLEVMKAQMAGEGVDVYFDRKAQADGKTLAYLESLDSQIQLLANMGEGYEDAFIRMNLAQFGDFKAYFSAMIDAWRAGDMTKLDELVVKPAQQLDPVLYQAMFVARNQAWLPQIQQMFANTEKELVLVGAGHLAGEHSVLALLQQAGYKVQQVH